ncbi:hypothetical protein [uncultured Albimonas sp.]|uniref:hypothetical protein n=1 Tax=uncultured Albimonas sp. TaxID=1331701 RepID=UPI0030EC3B15|tara:strand:- start:16 stop:705 length:690 start_codon:yes stop_codon:yes gene_type:complete
MTRKDVDSTNGGPAGPATAPGLGMTGARAAPLSAEAFRDLALTHGPDLGAWPAALRPAARACAEADPEGAALARAEAAALDDALEAWAAQTPDLSADLFARMAGDADAALPGGAAALALSATPAARPSASVRAASAPPSVVAEPRRGRPGGRDSSRVGRGRSPLMRFGASAAFAASAALGVVLGYVGDDPVSQGFAALAMDSYDQAYELSLLDADLLSDDAFPDAETVR